MKDEERSRVPMKNENGLVLEKERGCWSWRGRASKIEEGKGLWLYFRLWFGGEIVQR